MPKQKTRKIVQKRFKLTKNGKIKRKTAGVSHRSYPESTSRTNRKKKVQTLTGKFARKVKKMLGK